MPSTPVKRCGARPVPIVAPPAVVLDEDRGDAFGRGATGYGVRMLVELAARMAAHEHP